jgi:hypothetical protein
MIVGDVELRERKMVGRKTGGRKLAAVRGANRPVI